MKGLYCSPLLWQLYFLLLLTEYVLSNKLNVPSLMREVSRSDLHHLFFQGVFLALVPLQHVLQNKRRSWNIETFMHMNTIIQKPQRRRRIASRLRTHNSLEITLNIMLETGIIIIPFSLLHRSEQLLANRSHFSWRVHNGISRVLCDCGDLFHELCFARNLLLGGGLSCAPRSDVCWRRTWGHYVSSNNLLERGTFLELGCRMDSGHSSETRLVGHTSLYHRWSMHRRWISGVELRNEPRRGAAVCYHHWHWHRVDRFSCW